MPTYDPNDEYRLSIRQAVFDELGAQRATPNADRGRARRAYVKLPFLKAAFLSCFGEGKFYFHNRQADGTGRQNVKLQATRGELDTVLGVGWGSRKLSTSTVCEVDPSYPVGIKWFYKARIDFDHSVPTLHVARRLRQPTVIMLATETHDPWATLVRTKFLQKKDQPIAGNHNHFAITFLPILTYYW